MNRDREGFAMDASQQAVLYCIGASEDPAESEEQIHRALLLSSMAHPEPLGTMLAFRHLADGPFSDAVDRNLATLRSRGCLKGAGLELSDIGRDEFLTADQLLEEPLKATIRDSRDFVSGLTDAELLAFILALFPERIAEPAAAEAVERDRPNIAASMLQKGKVTASLAAEIACMSYFDFERFLNENGIRWKS